MKVADPEEIWKPVVGFEGLYEISNRGRLKEKGLRGDTLKRLKKLKHPDRELYSYDMQDMKGRYTKRMAKMLVAEAFCAPPPGKPRNYSVEHKNGNLLDFRPENLTWCQVKRAKTYVKLTVKPTDSITHEVADIAAAAAILGVRKSTAQHLISHSRRYPNTFPRIEVEKK